MEEKQFKDLKEILNQISNKLNILISPQFKRESQKQDRKITRENIDKLRKCGLNYIEISSILGIKPKTVANELTYLKKKGGKNAKKE